jgi:hypothetical protein
MAYDFSTLSPVDFEDLVRDLVSATLSIHIEGFGPGPDDGIDGRHASADGDLDLILQAKHRAGSTYPSLKSTMKKERSAIDRLQPNRYLLATSQNLTPKRKDELSRIIGPALKATADIFGRTELNDLLRANPKVEQAHLKLWLSSTSVLNRFLRSAAFEYTAASREEMLSKLRVYVPNPSFSAARKILEDHHVLIVSGPPGVGKTTLAQMLAYAYVGEDWRFVAIRSLEDGFSEIGDAEKVIFFFDDFLGKIALDRQALAAKDGELVRFILKVQRSKNARFILTTRAYIYEEARHVSENIGDQRLNITKYVLDVGVYTRRIRAHILYNHLAVSTLPAPYVTALILANVLSEIVDHENYNPRIIEWMTDSLLLKGVPETEYAQRFISALNDPADIWDRAFREHISPKGQHLLISLFFCDEYGTQIDELKIAYEAAHGQLCGVHRLASAPSDFEDSLQILEGSFITIRNRKVGFVNPSIRDYLDQYLGNFQLLAELAAASPDARWANSIWRRFKRIDIADSELSSAFVRKFAQIAPKFCALPTWRTKLENGRHIRVPHDLALTDRIKLLVEWYDVTRHQCFSDALESLVADPPDDFDSWRDGADLPELIDDFRAGIYEDFPGSGKISQGLEKHLIHLLANGCSSDDLGSIHSAVTGMVSPSDDLTSALVSAIRSEIDELPFYIGDLDESEIEQYSERILNLGSWAGLNFAGALQTLGERLEELKERGNTAARPSFPTGRSHERDDFDDSQLRSLFQTLI